MKINRNKFWLLAVILLLAISVQSCMETVEPSKSNKIKLKALALKVVDSKTNQVETLRGYGVGQG